MERSDHQSNVTQNAKTETLKMVIGSGERAVTGKNLRLRKL